MKKNNYDDFDGFMVNVFFDEDGDYLAHLVELPNVSAFGPTPAEALRELKTAWELMKECYQEDGEPVPKAPSRNGYQGPFNIPVDAELYHALTDEAEKSNMSLYALVTQKLSKTTVRNTDNIRKM
ncbi:type II toxin-antitoxin system HicB family antitoxin [Candidatus Poribacteria bacterium]|nr:type II toxin-antitoxin system HicB family antitoxin [Candidatus Poribacteria bacterium]